MRCDSAGHRSPVCTGRAVQSVAADSQVCAESLFFGSIQRTCFRPVGRLGPAAVAKRSKWLCRCGGTDRKTSRVGRSSLGSVWRGLTKQKGRRNCHEQRKFPKPLCVRVGRGVAGNNERDRSSASAQKPVQLGGPGRVGTARQSTD